jgi:VIT1/CCC1 family predicted Fe2+/Mn2+ transporter
MPAQPRQERHTVGRVGWLRAAVLGANDGIVSTASLIVGVAAAGAPAQQILLSGVAGLVAGAMSMAAGEYVSVSSQADAERADLAREAVELKDDPVFEFAELQSIYESRGVSPELAQQVAAQLMAKDPLNAHARDELGLSETTQARPIQAALTSALTFSAGAVLPLGATLLIPENLLAVAVSLFAILCLAVLGAVGAGAGGAPIGKAILRVTFWGALALLATAAIGRLFGTVI